MLGRKVSDCSAGICWNTGDDDPAFISQRDDDEDRHITGRQQPIHLFRHKFSQELSQGNKARKTPAFTVSGGLFLCAGHRGDQLVLAKEGPRTALMVSLV